ncbi:MAG: hypothetical protein JNK48_34900 [Bryobacterales bacterium]|nr:hypothetical protein [Bryobacterales bacterium]
MKFLRKPAVAPGRLGVLASAFHPPTKAHLALARAALDTFETEEVLFVLPERFPHKRYDGVTLEERLELVLAATAHEGRFSVAVAEAGLFLQIAREARGHYPPSVRLRFLCGRDAAERIVGWDYGELPPIEEQLEEFELLVAPRGGAYEAPAQLGNAIGELRVTGDWDEVASSRVRERVGAGGDWEQWIPESIAARVAQIYGKR